MQQIVVSADTVTAPGGVTNQVVICDANGVALGFFSPLREKLPVSELQLDSPLSIAATEALRQKYRTGKPLDEILGRLGY